MSSCYLLYPKYATNPPSHFLCPLTLDIMDNPVRDPVSGNNFERTAIVKWMIGDGNGTCPLTRRQLEFDELVEDTALSNKIRRWKIANRRAEKCVLINSTKDKEEQRVISLRDQILRQRDEKIRRAQEKLQLRVSVPVAF